jgi:hypothetical protein
MPVILPTPDELALMPWHKRDRALAQAKALLASYSRSFEPGGTRRHRMTDAQRQRSVQVRRKREAAWGAQVRAEAKRLEREGWGR